MSKKYLGDDGLGCGGVYAEFDGYFVTLTATYANGKRHRIALGPDVRRAFAEYVVTQMRLWKAWAAAEDDDTESPFERHLSLVKSNGKAKPDA